MYFGSFLILATGYILVGWIILGLFGGLSLIFTTIELIQYYN